MKFLSDFFLISRTYVGCNGFFKNYGRDHDLGQLGKAVPMSANQVAFSLTLNSAMYDGTLDDCLARKRLAMCWSTLGSFFRENNRKGRRMQRELEDWFILLEASQENPVL